MSIKTVGYEPTAIDQLCSQRYLVYKTKVQKNVVMVGIEPTCYQLSFQQRIRQREYITILLKNLVEHSVGFEPTIVRFCRALP